MMNAQEAWRSWVDYMDECRERPRVIKPKWNRSSHMVWSHDAQGLRHVDARWFYNLDKDRYEVYVTFERLEAE